MMRVFQKTIPLYWVIFILILSVGTGFFLVRKYWSTPTYNYQIYLPAGPAGTSELQFGSWPALANKDFFEQVKAQFIADKASFISADLTGMQLTLYADGQPALHLPIKTKGREGSWWETPAGLYRVEGKKKNHYSSFGHVYLPWSMPFQGNFFIHGWPYYDDGAPVSSGYSGGCIRLATEDAEALFERVRVGTPVLVYKEEFRSDNFSLRMKPPEILARSYLVADLNSNFVLAERNATASVPIASITKLMTALLGVEYVNIENEVTVTEKMIVPTSRPRLRPGEKISLYNLLPILLQESSNEAAEAIAGFLGRSRFIALMNQKAKAIGMTATNFADPAGREDCNIASAEDLFALTKYLYHNRRFVLDESAGRIDTRVYGPLLFEGVKNFNALKDDPGFVGGKVGLTTAAGETMLAILDVKFGGASRPIAIILLNTPDYNSEGEALKNW